MKVIAVIGLVGSLVHSCLTPPVGVLNTCNGIVSNVFYEGSFAVGEFNVECKEPAVITASVVMREYGDKDGKPVRSDTKFHRTFLRMSHNHLEAGRLRARTGYHYRVSVIWTATFADGEVITGEGHGRWRTF